MLIIKKRSLFFFILFYLSISSSITSHAADMGLLRIHGSNTIGAKLVPGLVESWLQKEGYTSISSKQTSDEEQLISAKHADGHDLRVEIQAHGSSTAFQDLEAGKADLGMASRPIKNSELQRLKSLGRLDSPQSEYILALDGLAIIVHPTNSMTTMNVETLRKIFTGAITDWSALGLPAGHINVYARDDKSGTYDTFKSLVLGKEPLIHSATRYESNFKLSNDVSKDKNGIGFTGVAYVNRSKPLAIADTGAVPLTPRPFNVSTEDYVLSRRLFLYLPENDMHPLAKSFAEYAVSQSAQNSVKELGFISQNVVTQEQKTAANASAEYKELTQQAERLSLNIRFKSGYTSLDNKAIRDVQRLADFMAKPENKNKELLILGFSDAKESLPYLSLALSIERADAVADYLIRNGLEPHKVRGFGQDNPVASNDTDHGRKYNRRVEVWIR